MSRDKKQFEQHRKKCIFEFYDGVKVRRVDVWAFMLYVQTQIPIEVVQLNAMNGENAVKLVQLTREYLKVPAWSEENEAGMTDGDVLEVFTGIMELAADEKKNTKPGAILPPSTGSMSLNGAKPINSASI